MARETGDSPRSTNLATRRTRIKTDTQTEATALTGTTPEQQLKVLILILEELRNIRDLF